MKNNSLFNSLKFKSIKQIDQSGLLAVGEPRDKEKGLSLLCNGKVIAKELEWVSTNLTEDTPHAQKKYLYALTKEKELMILNNHGGFETKDLIVLKDESKVNEIVEQTNELMYGLESEQGDIVVKYLVPTSFDGSSTQFILYPETHGISESFCEVGDYNGKNERKVKIPSGFYRYIDNKGQPRSIDFLEESEPDSEGNTILKIINNFGDDIQVICNDKHRPISRAYNVIIKENGLYVTVSPKGDKCIIDKTGLKLTEPYDKIALLNQGTKIIRKADTKTYSVIEPDYSVMIDNFKKPIVNQDTGIVYGIVQDIPVIFGYENIVHPVDENVARLVMNILNDQRMSRFFIDKIIEEQPNYNDTLKVFDSVLSKNLKYEPENEKIKQAQTEIPQRFVKSLKRSSNFRVRKYDKAMKELEEQKQKIQEQNLVASMMNNNSKILKQSLTNQTKTSSTNQTNNEDESGI